MSEELATTPHTMSDQQNQKQQKRNAPRGCLVGILECLLSLLLLPLVLAFGVLRVVFGLLYAVLFAVFFVGPFIYYRGTILNSHALAVKYATEGVRLMGRVVKRWKTGKGRDSGPTFHVQVVYRLMDGRDDGTHYTRELIVSQQFFTQSTLDLIYLPDYPRSAVLYASVQETETDEAFPPSKLPSVVFGFLWATLWNLIPVVILLTSIDECSYCTALIGPVFVGALVTEFAVGYWVAKRDRDSHLRRTLYGAKKVVPAGDGRDNNEPDRDGVPYSPEEEKIPERMSYQEFFHEDRRSCLFVVRNIVQDVLVVLGWVLVFVYSAVVGGGCILWNGLVVSRWEHWLLGRYDSYGDHKTVTGVTALVVCRQVSNRVIVQYTVNDQTYKKRLTAPEKLVRRGACRKYREHESVPDDPELRYQTHLPTSAELKSRIDNRNQELKIRQKQVGAGIVLMLLQIGFPTLFAGMAIQADVDTYESGPFLIVAGICLGCHLVLGLVGACVHYHFFFKKHLLYGAKKVQVRDTSQDVVALDEELNDIDTGVWLNDGATDATASTSEENAESFVDQFMKGKFPRLDKL